jgi:DNA-binding MarR family transcriptional regulator
MTWTLKDLERHVAILQILNTIHEREGLAIRELLDMIDASQGSAMRSVEHLIDVGLLSESRMDTFPFRRELSLTKKGREVAEHVSEIGKIVGSIKQS